VPKDEIPSPFVNDLPSLFTINNKDHDASSPSNKTESITEDGTNSQVSPGLRFASLSAQLHNWLFDRLSVSAQVPIDIKMDIIANFEEAYDSFVADLTQEADLGSANPWESMADRENKAPLQDLNLDWSLLATSAPTPIFEFSDNEFTAEATTCDEPMLGIRKVTEEANIHCYTFHGLPNSTLPATYPMFDQWYSDTCWDAFQPSMASPRSSINEESLWDHNEQLSASNVTAHYAADKKMIPDCGHQLLTPPATPSDCHSPLDTKEALCPDLDTSSGVSMTPSINMMDATASEQDFNVSDFLNCLEDEQYYFNDSLGLDYYYNRDV
jgi:hypothetical protein